ncbi:MAG: glycosyltransferase family 39 protein [Chrysiogenetes bacterium]|nr:glycosyltransferase family 39 protein [Chrysiogenetes bacterium]
MQKNWPKHPLTLSAIVFPFVLVLALSMGGFTDDPMHSVWGRDTPVFDILTLRAGPFPIRLLLWKFAVWVRPERPFDVMHIFPAVAHALNVGLVLALLRQFCTPRGALLWALFFLVYRPANEGVLWASTQPDVICTTFSLLALLAWRRGVEDSRWRLVALGLILVATATKLSAVVLPFLLMAHVLWMEEQTTVRERIRCAAPLLAPLALILVGYALWMAAHRGLWQTAYEPETFAVWKFLRIGENIARGLLLIRPINMVKSDAFGFLVLLVTVAAIWRSRGLVRFGLLWMVGFVGISAFSSGYIAGRYLYSASVGLILACSQLAVWADANAVRRRIAICGASLWMLVSLYCYQRDVRYFSCWGDVYREASALVRDHREDVRRAGRLAVARDFSPVNLWSAWLVRYEVGEGIETELQLPACPSDGRPCLSYGEIAEETVTAAGSLPVSGCEGHVTYRPPTLPR